MVHPNLPTGQTYQVMHLGHTATNTVQMAISNTSDRMFIRRSNSALWNDWHEVSSPNAFTALPASQTYQIVSLAHTATNRAQLAFSNSSDRLFFRRSNSATWQNWREISIRNFGANLPAGGVYQIMSLGHSATNRAQMAFSNNENRAFVRRSNSATWGNWHEIVIGRPLAWAQTAAVLIPTRWDTRTPFALGWTYPPNTPSNITLARTTFTLTHPVPTTLTNIASTADWSESWPITMGTADSSGTVTWGLREQWRWGNQYSITVGMWLVYFSHPGGVWGPRATANNTYRNRVFTITT